MRSSPFDFKFGYEPENPQRVFYNRKTIFVFEPQKILPQNVEKLSFVILGAKKISDNFDYKKALFAIYKYLEQFKLYEIIFILGHLAGQVEKYVKNPFDRVIIARKENDVIYSSFKQALYVISPDSDWVVMHFLKNYDMDLSFVNNIIRKATKRIIVPTFNGHPGHPLIFKREIIEDLKKIRKELGFPYILRRFSDEVEYVEVNAF